MCAGLGREQSASSAVKAVEERGVGFEVVRVHRICRGLVCGNEEKRRLPRLERIRGVASWLCGSQERL